MLYSDVITDICSQLGDPDKDQYESRAKAHFGRAISEFISAGQYSEEDLPYYILLKTNLSFINNPYDTSELNLLRPIKIFPDPAAVAPLGITATIVDLDRVALMDQNADLRPQVSDVFIYQVGTKLYCLTAASGALFNSAANTLFMKYLKDVDISGWADSLDLQGATYYLSFGFTRRCIARAVETLKIEDQRRS